MNKSVPRISVTPVVKKDELEGQIQEQINVLYSQETSLWEKEEAALNYRHLFNYYGALFHASPTHLTK